MTSYSQKELHRKETEGKSTTDENETDSDFLYVLFNKILYFSSS